MAVATLNQTNILLCPQRNSIKQWLGGSRRRTKAFDDIALNDKFLGYLTGHTPPTTTVSSARQKVISVSSLGPLNQVTCPMHIDSSPKFKVSKQFNPTTTMNIKLKVIFMHGYYWGDLTIKADPSYTVAQVKTIIVNCWYDFGLEI